MGSRALAHIEKVVSVYPIDGADKVEMTQVMDFHVVTKKGDCKVGDLMCYVEVDSILPDGLPTEKVAEIDDLKKQIKKAEADQKKSPSDELASSIVEMTNRIAIITSMNRRPEFEFLRSKKFRIKALKYGMFKTPIISQGILFPLDIVRTINPNIAITEGLDVTELLGITKVVEDSEEDRKQESESNTITKKIDKWMMKRSWYRKLKKSIFGQNIKGTWQDWMPRVSDEENVQKLFTKIKDEYGDSKGWYVTNKIEGQNISTFYLKEKYFFNLLNRATFGVCSRTRYLKTYSSGEAFWNTVIRLDIEAKMKKIGKNLFLRGEHTGTKIQGNLYKLPETKIYLFEVYDIDAQRYYTYDEFIKFCNEYGFDHVPVVEEDFSLFPTVQDMLDYSNGTDELVAGVKVAREGVVFRRKDNPAISFKVKSPAYMILHGK